MPLNTHTNCHTRQVEEGALLTKGELDIGIITLVEDLAVQVNQAFLGLKTAEDFLDVLTGWQHFRVKEKKRKEKGKRTLAAFVDFFRTLFLPAGGKALILGRNLPRTVPALRARGPRWFYKYAFASLALSSVR